MNMITNINRAGLVVGLFLLAGCNAKDLPVDNKNTNASCQGQLSIDCKPVSQLEQDTDSLANNYPNCAEITSAAWCRQSHGNYLFALSPLTSSSSSSSSGLSLSSSSSSGGGAPFVPPKQFGHAPSLAWVEEAGWQFTPGAYRIAPNYFNDVNPNTFYPTEPVKDFAVAAPFTQRGSVYEISVQVKLSEVTGGANVSLAMVDSVIVLLGDDQFQIRDITKVLEQKSLTTNNWVTFTGQFEFWGSSGLTLQIKGGKPFVIKDLTARLVGEGSLTGNPIIPGRD